VPLGVPAVLQGGSLLAVIEAVLAALQGDGPRAVPVGLLVVRYWVG